MMENSQDVQHLINWLKVLSDGYVKPDVNKNLTGNSTGVVRDTKDSIPYMNVINDKLVEHFGLNKPDLSDVNSRRNRDYTN